MSTKLFSGTITTRYGEPEKDIYQQVIDLVEKEKIAKSRAQLLLVKRGLQHTQNPEPLIKTVKEVVEKIVPKDRYPYCKDCAGKPKVHKSIPHIEEHITDGHIRGDLQNTGQRASADKLTTRDKADPPSSSSKALKEKKSASEKNGISGWTVAGGLGVVGLVLYLLFK